MRFQDKLLAMGVLLAGMIGLLAPLNAAAETRLFFDLVFLSDAPPSPVPPEAQTALRILQHPLAQRIAPENPSAPRSFLVYLKPADIQSQGGFNGTTVPVTLDRLRFPEPYLWFGPNQEIRLTNKTAYDLTFRVTFGPRSRVTKVPAGAQNVALPLPPLGAPQGEIVAEEFPHLRATLFRLDTPFARIVESRTDQQGRRCLAVRGWPVRPGRYQVGVWTGDQWVLSGEVSLNQAKELFTAPLDGANHTFFQQPLFDPNSFSCGNHLALDEVTGPGNGREAAGMPPVQPQPNGGLAQPEPVVVQPGNNGVAARQQAAERNPAEQEGRPQPPARIQPERQGGRRQEERPARARAEQPAQPAERPAAGQAQPPAREPERAAGQQQAGAQQPGGNGGNGGNGAAQSNDQGGQQNQQPAQPPNPTGGRRRTGIRRINTGGGQ